MQPWISDFAAEILRQFFVEAHSSINDRVFSYFAWPSQLYHGSFSCKVSVLT